jgi:Cd2+/Zn2+-exporting ATPase
MLVKYDLKNLDCANCAAKIESSLKKHPAVKEVSIDFATLTLHIDTNEIDSIRREIKKIEPDVDISIPDQDRHSTVPSQKFHPVNEVAIVVAAGVLFLIQLLFEQQLHRTPWGLGEYIIAISAYLLAGWNVLAGAFKTIKKGRLFDENVLMTIATSGAFAIHAISEAVGVMIFFKTGEFLQNLAVSRSRKSIKSLLEIRPDYANIKTDTGIKKTSPDNVKPGDIIVVKPGEKIPLDGIIENGTSLVNTAALTGESVPSTVKPGDVVLAGEINTTAMLTIKVSKTFADSSITKILDLVENATAKKARTEQFITRFARYYTPTVVFLSLLIAVLPPLLFSGEAFQTWIYRALVLLVISCPCALMISIPLGYFGGIGGASRRGILLKGSNIIDAIAGVKTVVYDKTGTLTKGSFKVKEVVTCNGYSENQVLMLAALAETYSSHPVAKSIIEEAANSQMEQLKEEILDHQEISGYGVKVHTTSRSITVGNDALMHRENIEHSICDAKGTVVHVVVDRLYAGYIIIGDELKEDAHNVVQLLRNVGIQTIAMLTGDNESSGKIVADDLGLDMYYAELLPEDKVHRLEMIASNMQKKGKVAFIGDGINDAPVLARADVGIAMGSSGTDAAIETADVILMTDHPSKVAEAIRISKRTRSIVWQNIIFALLIKVLFISFGAFGLTGMWEAVFADMGTALIAVLNSTRALKG